MTLIAVAPDIMQKAFKEFDDRDRIPWTFEVLELREALEREYDTDAHLIIYVFPEKEKMQRITKSGLECLKNSFDTEPEVQALFCDADNPGHADWNDELLAKAKEQYDSLEILQTTGIYHTSHGSRIVQPLAKPIKVSEVEPYIYHWYQELEDEGVRVDWKCRDWTHMFRLPNVLRDGVAYRSDLMLLDRMKPIELKPMDPGQFQIIISKLSASKKSNITKTKIIAAPGVVQPNVVWSDKLPEIWRERVRTIADAVYCVQSEWHSLFMAIAGSLISRGVPLEEIPLINQAISQATGADTRTEDRVEGANSTIAKFQAGLPYTGHTKLKALWPNVAAAIEEAVDGAELEQDELATLIDGFAAGTTAATSEGNSAGDLLAVSRWLEEKIKNASAGLTLIDIGNYLHRTQAILNVAAERATKKYASPNAKGVRAPKNSKTAIAFKKNAEAIAQMDLVRVRGVEAKRRYAPLSLMDESGSPVCRYHRAANHLVSGGYSILWELCQGRNKVQCKYYSECTAKDCIEGPSDSRVVLGTHGLLGVLSDDVGNDGLLAMEGPPDVLETFRFSESDLAIAEDSFDKFDIEYIVPIKPAFEAVKIWAETYGKPGVAHSIPEIIESMYEHLDEADVEFAIQAGEDSDLLTCVANAQLPYRFGNVPPIRLEFLSEARESAELAEQIGIASKLLGAILQGAKEPNILRLRIDKNARKDKRTLVITRVREPVAKALNRKGPVVVIDHSIGPKFDVYAKLTGFEPEVHELVLEDLTNVECTWYSYYRANRKNWLPSGKLSINRSLTAAIRSLVDWASSNSAATHLGIITNHTIELALRIAFNPDDNSLAETWIQSGQTKKSIDKVKRELGSIVSIWQGDVSFGHYGALDQADDMTAVDCLATLGDPWPNMGETLDEATYIEDMKKWKERAVEYCHDELTRAHDLPFIADRKKFGRALHIGKIRPNSKEWNTCVATKLITRGRPRNDNHLAVQQLRKTIDNLGGVSTFAKKIGCHRRTVYKYLNAEAKPDKNFMKKFGTVFKQ